MSYLNFHLCSKKLDNQQGIKNFGGLMTRLFYLLILLIGLNLEVLSASALETDESQLRGVPLSVLGRVCNLFNYPQNSLEEERQVRAAQEILNQPENHDRLPKEALAWLYWRSGMAETNFKRLVEFTVYSLSAAIEMRWQEPRIVRDVIIMAGGFLQILKGTQRDETMSHLIMPKFQNRIREKYLREQAR
jgi:hypothetical protein